MCAGHSPRVVCGTLPAQFSIIPIELIAYLSPRISHGAGIPADRLTTIKNCDAIIVIDKGRKVEEGTHAELLLKPISFRAAKSGREQEGAGEEATAEAEADKELASGFYHQLWQTQMGELSHGLHSSEERDIYIHYIYLYYVYCVIV